ncbi:MAG TPA: ABC transporter ATP-binding protein [Trueperaceae bacterium]|nr:ABC transporter ATP-binding protein [Trueperaceae bacterium]
MIVAAERPLVTTGLGKRYGSVTALSSLDLELSRGEVFGLIGPNGAGKTTTMRLLLDIIRPTAGEARVLGIDPRRGGAELRRHIGYLPGELRLEGRSTVRTALSEFARISGPVATGAIERLCQRLGLDLDRRIGQLSKGNKQKLGIIQAFMHRPRLLVLDEPTSGLDPLVQQEFLAMVTEASAAGQTVLLSSHVLSEIEHAADRVGVLHEGNLVMLGSLSDLRLAHRRRAKAVFGAPPAVVEARLSSTTLAGATITSHAVGAVLDAHVDDIDAFVKAIAGLPVKDLVVTEPQLEEIVLDLYRSTGGTHEA